MATSVRRSLDAWAGKPGLAGTDPPAVAQRRVLGELAEWAAAAFDEGEHVGTTVSTGRRGG